jgi:hypothetical protein
MTGLAARKLKKARRSEMFLEGVTIQRSFPAFEQVGF